MSTAVEVLWWITLVATIVLVVPVLLYLLSRTLRSARDIRNYTADTLAAAEGIARNLEGAAELARTPALALRVRDAAAAVAASLPGRADGPREG